MGSALACSRRSDHPAPPAISGPAHPLHSNADAVQPSPPVAPPARAGRQPEALNVILITLDAWRADVPWTGYARRNAPRLQELANESVVWEDEHALSSHTPQSLAALLSGRYPCSLYRDGKFDTSYSNQNTFFPELLQKHGIRTLSVQADPVLRSGSGFEQGFDTWQNLPSDEPKVAEGTTPELVERLIELLRQPENESRQFFAWTHLPEPRAPYPAHSGSTEFGASERDRYDAQVFFTDLWIGKLLDFARREPWWARTAVIVTGAHGEALGEHGLHGHGQDLWEVLLRVPLVIRAPGATPSHIRAARSQLDLAPTVLELMRVAGLAGSPGQSQVGELYGEPAEPRPALLFQLCEDERNPGVSALIAGDDKLIVPIARGAALRLFDLKADPGEIRDASEQDEEKLIQVSVREEREFEHIPSVEPYGGAKLQSGRMASGSDPASAAAKPPRKDQ
jgi:choline-sulfatase